MFIVLLTWWKNLYDLEVEITICPIDRMFALSVEMFCRSTSYIVEMVVALVYSSSRFEVFCRTDVLFVASRSLTSNEVDHVFGVATDGTMNSVHLSGYRTSKCGLLVQEIPTQITSIAEVVNEFVVVLLLSGEAGRG